MIGQRFLDEEVNTCKEMYEIMEVQCKYDSRNSPNGGLLA